MGGNPSPYLVTAVLFGLAVVLTQFMSNTRLLKLCCAGWHCTVYSNGCISESCTDGNPDCFQLCIRFSGRYSSEHPGTCPGKYKFMDYVKCGGGLVAVSMIVAIIVIPIVWPFFPTAA